MGILTPKGLYFFILGLMKEGVNLNAILLFASRKYGDKIAFNENDVDISFTELYQASLNLAGNLSKNLWLKSRKQPDVALLGRNSKELIVSIFAFAKLGANIYMLNPDMSDAQINSILKNRSIDLLVADDDLMTNLIRQKPVNTIVFRGNSNFNVHLLSQETTSFKFKKRRSGRLIVLTGGTTGIPKIADRKQSVFNFLLPLIALVKNLELHKHEKVYIPIPIFHGYGLATIVMSVLLGKQGFITDRFDAESSLKLIKDKNIEIMTLVPTMLQRLMTAQQGELNKLNKILSGGASLNPRLVEKCMSCLGPKLFNLYGSSEAGFSVLATPSDLLKHSSTIGRPIYGTKLRIEENKEIGVLEIRNSWVMQSKRKKWVNTGDLAHINKEGYIFLKGRKDTMIVSGGENVYPIDVENVINFHPKVACCAVIGMEDENFGECLIAFVVKRQVEKLNESNLKLWLSKEVARYQLPKKIVFVKSLPNSSLGKLNYNELKISFLEKKIVESD